jgi:hypothetical protein
MEREKEILTQINTNILVFHGQKTKQLLKSW